MAAKNIEFRVGVVILLGLIILAGSLFWLQGYQLEQNSQKVYVRFADVGTLAAGDRVTVHGVRSGKVNNLSLENQGVVVELLLDRGVVLKKDASFLIKNLGLMGERFIAISPGTDSALFDAADTVVGKYDTGLPDVLGILGDMIQEIRSFVHTFKTSFGSSANLARIDSTLANIEKVSVQLSGYLSRNQSKMDQTADNFYYASKDIKRLLSDNASRVDSASVRMDRVTRKLDGFVNRLDSLATAFRQFADDLNNPEGSLQLMMEDRRLYDDLRRTADNIDALVSDIRANPRKYINLKVELF